jgi:hypothetical protein
MNAPEHFTIVGEQGESRPGGPLAAAEAVRLIARAIVWAREQRIARLLVVIRPLTVTEPPGLGDRYFLIREWAAAAAGAVTVAIVAPAELLDPQRFGVTVAANSGFRANVFTSEAEARAWLAEPTATGTSS